MGSFIFHIKNTHVNESNVTNNYTTFHKKVATKSVTCSNIKFDLSDMGFMYIDGLEVGNA